MQFLVEDPVDGRRSSWRILWMWRSLETRAAKESSRKASTILGDSPVNEGAFSIYETASPVSIARGSFGTAVSIQLFQACPSSRAPTVGPSAPCPRSSEGFG